MKTLLLFLGIISIVSSDWIYTGVDFNTTLICRDRVTHAPLDNWCYSIEFLHLGFFYDGNLVKSQKCSKSMVENLKLNATLSYKQEEQHGNKIEQSFKLGTKIRHNCTVDGKTLMRYRGFTWVPGRNETFKYDLGIDLFEDGTEENTFIFSEPDFTSIFT